MNTTNKMVIAKMLRNTVVICTAAALTLACATEGDSRASQGASSGAAFGAGIGLLLGVLSGEPEKAARGLVAGAAYGAAVGGYEGWRQDQDDDRTRQITAAIRESGAADQRAALDAESLRREQLTRFLGVWQLEGWAQAPGQHRLNVTAQVNGNVHMTYFVELAYIDVKADGIDGQVWGTTTLGYDADSGFEISTRFNTLPDAIEISGGRFDNGSRAFEFTDAEGTTLIRFETPDRFTVTTTVNGQMVESYVVTRS